MFFFHFQVVLGLLVAGCQCWKAPVVNLGRRAQYYLQQNDGTYQYGFDTAEGLYQTQEGDNVNEVRGKFGAEGGELQYTAGVGGFVVTSHKKADAPATKTYVSRGPVRYATLEELATHPEQVDDTAEVKAAKASFKAAYDAAAAAAEAAPDVNIITGAVPVVAVNTATYSAPQTAYLAPAPVAIKYEGPSAPLDASGRVEETAEVKAAKASFQAAYDAAAAAAEAAPDVNIITASSQAAAALPVVSTYGQGASSIASDGAIDGSYQFSYATSDSSRHESADAVNNVKGNFEFVADDAQRRRVDYQAGAATGFIASGAHLPVSVQDTAAVAAAKASFRSAYNTAAAAAEAAPDTDIITGAVPVVAVNTATYSAPQTAYLAPAPVAIKYEGPSAPLDASGRVEDTAEVKAAKASFKAAYDAAAAAAEAAPDVNIITGAAPVVAVNTATYSAPQTAYLAPAPVAIKYEGPSAPLDASGRVEDTAEVKAAKAAFKAAFDAAAAAAEAAPDTGIITASNQGQAYSTASFPVSQTTYSASHGNMRTITFDGITLMQADGPIKFGYSYE